MASKQKNNTNELHVLTTHSNWNMHIPNKSNESIDVSIQNNFSWKLLVADFSTRSTPYYS